MADENSSEQIFINEDSDPPTVSQKTLSSLYEKSLSGYTCLTCNRTYASRRYVLFHLTNTHKIPTLGWPQCLICRKLFTKPSKLVIHMKAHQKSGDNAYFPSPTLTVTPKVTMKDEKNSKKIPTKKRSLKIAKPKILTISFQRQHLPITYNDNPYKCYDCFKSFLMPENRTQHIHLIHGVPLDSIEQKLQDCQNHEPLQENTPPVTKTTLHSSSTKTASKSILKNNSNIAKKKETNKTVEATTTPPRATKIFNNTTTIETIQTSATVRKPFKKSKKSNSEKANKSKDSKNNKKTNNKKKDTSNKLPVSSTKKSAISSLPVTPTLSAPRKPIPKLPRTVSTSEEPLQLTSTPQNINIYPHSIGQKYTPKTPKNDSSSSYNTSGSDKQTHLYYPSSSSSGTTKHYTDTNFNKSTNAHSYSIDDYSGRKNENFQGNDRQARLSESHSDGNKRKKHYSSSSSHHSNPRKHSTSHESRDYYSSHIRSDRYSASSGSYDRSSQLSPHKYSSNNRSNSEYRSREDSDQKKSRNHSYSHHHSYHSSSREISHHSSASKQTDNHTQGVDSINKSSIKRSNSLSDDVSNDAKKVKLTLDNDN